MTRLSSGRCGGISLEKFDFVIPLTEYLVLSLVVALLRSQPFIPGI